MVKKKRMINRSVDFEMGNPQPRSLTLKKGMDKVQRLNRCGGFIYIKLLRYSPTLFERIGSVV